MGAPKASGGKSRVVRRSIRPPKGHTSHREARKPPRSAGPPRYTNRSVRPLLLQSALEAASRRGYQALRISDITDPVNVTRQAFYLHFRDKRHCLCEALDPRLAAVVRMAADDSEGRERFGLEWSREVLASVDEVLGEYFGSAEGTKGRLLEAMAEELEEAGSLARVRVGSLVKRARVPQGDFYRCFSGKRECFAVLYEQLVEEVLAEAAQRTGDEPGSPTDAFLNVGDALLADPRRLRMLVYGSSELPETPGKELAGAWRGTLAEAWSEAAGGSGKARAMASAAVEVVRSSVLNGQEDRLSARLESLPSLLPDRRDEGQSSAEALAA